MGFGAGDAASYDIGTWNRCGICRGVIFNESDSDRKVPKDLREANTQRKAQTKKKWEDQRAGLLQVRDRPSPPQYESNQRYDSGDFSDSSSHSYNDAKCGTCDGKGTVEQKGWIWNSTNDCTECE